MNNTLNMIDLETIIGKNASTQEDGQQVFEIIHKYLKDDKCVAIIFTNIETLTATFLNAAIGQLYNEFTSDYVKNHITLINIQPDDLQTLKKVTTNAKMYFQNNSKRS